MLYSLPSRELIADSVEYMVNAHCADAMVCISNCDKITPGMLMASLRLNIPVIFVSGGPMEAGKTKLSDKIIKLDLVDAMIQGADPKVSDEQSNQVERSACPTCGSCSGMFTANSMNCLTEALGLSQPGNGSLLATHADRKELFLNAGKRIVELTKRYYEQDDASALPGITRDAIIKLAKDLGIEVREQVLSRESLYLADEVFMSGTAAEITPVRSVDGIQVGAGRRGPVTKRIQEAFFGLFTGETEDKWGWLDPVSK